uniref:Beta-defensin n=1 Tax=Catagonus wagneri TaxID=51154 RepID=A0A8C3YL73_9CETA
ELPLGSQIIQYNVSLSKARSSFLHEGCSGGRQNCKMKCNNDEYAVNYCADWTICCGVKKTEFKKKAGW